MRNGRGLIEKSGRGLLMSMIQPRNQRHHVLDVDCKLEISQCLIYIASYSLRSTFTYIISFAFQNCMIWTEGVLISPTWKIKDVRGREVWGQVLISTVKKVPGLESNAWPSNSAFSPAVCVPTLSDCQTFP